MNVFFLAILLAPIYAEHDDLTLQQRNGVRVTKNHGGLRSRNFLDAKNNLQTKIKVESLSSYLRELQLSIEPSSSNSILGSAIKSIEPSSSGSIRATSTSTLGSTVEATLSQTIEQTSETSTGGTSNTIKPSFSSTSMSTLINTSIASSSYIDDSFGSYPSNTPSSVSIQPTVMASSLPTLHSSNSPSHSNSLNPSIDPSSVPSHSATLQPSTVTSTMPPSAGNEISMNPSVSETTHHYQSPSLIPSFKSSYHPSPDASDRSSSVPSLLSEITTKTFMFYGVTTEMIKITGFDVLEEATWDFITNSFNQMKVLAFIQSVTVHVVEVSARVTSVESSAIVEFVFTGISTDSLSFDAALNEVLKNDMTGFEDLLETVFSVSTITIQIVQDGLVLQPSSTPSISATTEVTVIKATAVIGTAAAAAGAASAAASSASAAGGAAAASASSSSAAAGSGSAAASASSSSAAAGSGSSAAGSSSAAGGGGSATSSSSATVANKVDKTIMAKDDPIITSSVDRQTVETIGVNSRSQMECAIEPTNNEPQSVLTVATAQMLKYNNNEVVNRANAINFKRQQSSFDEHTLLRKIRVLFFVVLSAVKLRMKTNLITNIVHQKKRFSKKLMVRVKNVIGDLSFSTNKFYAWRLEEQQRVTDKLRKRKSYS